MRETSRCPGGEIGYKDTGLGFRTINNIGEQKLIKYFDGAVWLTHFDALSVPFYQEWENEKSAKNADLLIGIGETIGSGERCATGDEVRKSLDKHNVAHESYEWYIRLKDEFPLKTTGFGMGIERYILWLLKHNDIRDCQILPRFNGVNILP